MKTVREMITPVELCALCGRRSDGRGNFGLCSQCEDELIDVPGPFIVNIPVSDDVDQSPLQCLAVTEYGGLPKRLIQTMKISWELSACPVLCGSSGYGRFFDHIAIAQIPGPEIIVPVPASRNGRRRRGFDQSLQMARYLPVPAKTVLKRRTGRQQKSLTRLDRLTNAEKQYMYRGILRRTDKSKSERSGTEVLLLDDVVTTGASLGRCAALVRDAGFCCSRAIVCVIKR